MDKNNSTKSKVLISTTRHHMNNDIVKLIDSQENSVDLDTNLVILSVFLITFTGYAAPAYGSIIPMLFKRMG